MIATADELAIFNYPDGTRIGFTSGCFDLFHFYHLHYLERCRAECDVLIVGVDSDALLATNKAKNPTIPEYHRAAVVGALKCVGAVFVMRNMRQFRLVADKANVVFKNSMEIYGQPLMVPEGKVMVIPDVEEVQSTTAIMAKIRGA